MPPASQNVANLGKFLGIVEAATGVRCVLYLGIQGWTTILGKSAGFSGHPLWVAQYPTSPAKPPPPADRPSILDPPPPQITAWQNWTIWQYTSSGSVAGANVDLDVFNGLPAQLQALCQT